MKDSPPRLDYNRSKIAAYVVVAGFLALMLVFGIRSATGPNLADGDRLESLSCPVCRGSGQGKGEAARCAACLGSKKLKAVVPGPNHPLDIRGTIRDLRAFPSLADGREVSATEARDQKLSLTPVKGAVPNASIVFEGPAGRTEFATRATGRFWGVILPGEYRLTVKAAGFADKVETVTIAPRKNPIWPEVVGPDAAGDETVRSDIFLLKG